MTHDDAARWLDAYIEAWRTYDPAQIGSLFADDAEYRYHPWNEPLRGRDAIVASWTSDQDAPGSWEAAYAPWAVDGNRVVATGTHTELMGSVPGYLALVTAYERADTDAEVSA